MGEFADLGIRFTTQGAEQARSAIDAISKAARIAEDATDEMAAAAHRETSAMDAMWRSVEKAVRQHEAIQRAALQAAGATDRLTAAQTKAAQAAAMHFDTLYDAGQRDFFGAYNRGAAEFVSATNRSGKAAGLAGYEMVNFGRQIGDVGTMAALGAGPLTILATQGFQVAEIFGVARARGVTFGAALGQMATAAGRLLATFAPLIVAGGAVAGAFLIWRKHVDDTKAALEATKKATEGFAETQDKVRDALGTAADFAEKYRVTNVGLTKALDGVLSSQSAAYRETLSGIGAMDAATQAAHRRAEMERLATVAILKRAAAEAEARAKESDAAAKAARGPARMRGTLVGIGLAGMPDALSVAAEAEAARFKELGGEAARKAAADEREYAKALKETADALMREKLILPETAAQRSAGAAAAREAAKAAREHARAEEEFNRALQGVLRSLETASERQLREMHEGMTTLRKALDLGKISVGQYREAIDRMFPAVVSATDAQKAWNAELTKTPADLAKGVAAIDDATTAAIDDFLKMRRSWDDVFYAIRNRDWVSAFAGLRHALQQVQAAFSKTATMGEKVGAISAFGDALGNAIGGRTGRSLSSAASAGQTAFMLTGNPVIAGLAAAVAGLTEFLKGKPSNEGAGYSLVTGEFSGKSRTADTERAVKSAADAIRQGQDLLKAAGIELGATVHGLVIGTRDLSQIYLTNGRTVTSAVGDAAAAAEAGLRAVLEAATYASEAQEKVARSALAAGKSFDEVIAILGAFEAAQGILGGIQDEILRLRDPKAFDLQEVARDIEAQRKAAQAAADAGHLTAEQLAAVNAELGVLESLRLDEVLKRYGDALTDQAAAIEQARQAAETRTQDAQRALVDAYNREASAIQATIGRMRDMQDAMRDFRRDLTAGPLANNNAFAQYRATSSEFMAAQAALRANPGDVEAYGRFQSASQAFLEAAKVIAPNSERYNRDLEAVRRATEEAEKLAGAQVDKAEAQLAALTAMVGQLVQLNAGVMTVAQAIANLQNALAVQRQLGVANDNAPAIDVTRYLAGNPDLAANWMAGGSLRGAGATLEEAALAHWRTTGQMEVAQGLRTYVRGGAHPGGLRLVGEQGPELEVTGPARYFDANETARLLSGRDSGELVAEVRALRQEVTAQGSELRAIKRDTGDLRTEAKRSAALGVFVRGEKPEDPIRTEAA